jgi:hypothetical protein
VSTLAHYHHSREHRALLRSLCPVLCPPDIDELGITEAVIDYLELYMRALPPLVRRALVLGMTSYDLAARAYPRSRGRRAGQLDRETALAYFRFWSHGVALMHTFAKGLKGLLTMSYYEQPEALARLGYTPDAWVGKVKKRRLEVYADDIARHEATIFLPDPLPITAAAAAAATGTATAASVDERAPGKTLRFPGRKGAS